jgi:CRP-like cAMP-binding protein
MGTKSPAMGYRSSFLNALPANELALLESQLETVQLRAGQVLQTAGVPVEHVYFPESGMVSFVTAVDGKEQFEVVAVGLAGMIGTDALRADGTTMLTAVCTIEGSALRLSRQQFWNAIQTCSGLGDRAEIYRDQLTAASAQTAACMASHELNQRLPRWLLKVTHAVGSMEFAMTQETIASLLGVRRPTLSAAAHSLQAAGVISVRRGEIAILDHEALEASACSCYQVLKARYVRYLKEVDLRPPVRALSAS